MGNWFGRRQRNNNNNNKDDEDEPLVVLVTGASSGIGKAVALDLLSSCDGYIVYGAARRVDDMADIVKAGGHAIEMDITNDVQVSEAIARILREQDNRIDVLFNNTGISVFGSMEDVPMEEFRRVMNVNFFGAVNLTQKVIPHMRKQPIMHKRGKRRRGLIINNSSIAGIVYGPFWGSYYSSKHALEAWSDCLRVELSPWDIDVTILQPGYIQTDIINVSPNVTPPNSVYQSMVESFIDATKQYMKHAPNTSVITKAVRQAIQAKPGPKRRYLFGYMAYPVWFLRTWLGDGILDYLLCAPLKP